MKEIHEKISREAIKAELTSDKFLRKTNKSGNEIYIVTHHNSPNIMIEIGRLREISFRLAGGGTGEDIDIDAYDIQENPYKQLFVWDPDAEEILGGYRYMLGSQIPIDNNGVPMIATSKLFHFTEKFTVITSYSIHYTKLYDRFRIRVRCPTLRSIEALWCRLPPSSPGQSKLPRCRQNLPRLRSRGERHR